MAYTKVQIVSNALCMLGQKPIIALQSQSDIVTAAEQAFDFLLPAILASNVTWRFATTIVQLAQLVAVPVVTDWAHIYQLPANYLKLVRLYPQNYDFEIYADGKLYSNLANPLYIEYVFQPDVGQLPAPFGLYLSYEIASYLCLSNAQYAQFASVIDGKLPMIKGIAMAADAQNRPQTPIISQPIITTRAVSTFVHG